MSDKNLIKFKEEFIVAGPRSSVVNILNIIESMSGYVEDRNKANHLLHSKEQIVLLCINNGTNDRLFGTVKVLTRRWWDLWHNRKKKITRNCIYKTYNARSQKKKILTLMDTKDVPLLIPEKE